MKKSEVETVINLLTEQMTGIELYEEHCLKKFLENFNVNTLHEIEYWDSLFSKIDRAKRVIARRLVIANNTLETAKDDCEETENKTRPLEGSIEE